MLAELSGVGEVVGRMAAAVERLARLLVHVSEQRLQQVFLAGEVLVERPGSAVRRSRDVADLGVQVTALSANWRSAAAFKGSLVSAALAFRTPIARPFLWVLRPHRRCSYQPMLT